MKVRILKAENPMSFYADKIGEVFEVEPARNGFTTTKEIATNCYGYIHFEEAEVVNV